MQQQKSTFDEFIVRKTQNLISLLRPNSQDTSLIHQTIRILNNQNYSIDYNNDNLIQDQLFKKVQDIHQNDQSQIIRLQELLQMLRRSQKISKKNQSLLCLLKLSKPINNQFSQLQDLLFEPQNYKNLENPNNNNNFRKQNIPIQTNIQQTMNNQSDYQNNQNFQQQNQNNIQLFDQVIDRGNKKINLKEKDLVKDLISFVFQGFDGSHIHFVQGKYRVVVPIQLPIQELVEDIAQLGQYFKYIQDYIRNDANSIQNYNNISISLTEQAFKTAIKDALSDYYRTIASLQARDDITLQKLQFWIQDPISLVQCLHFLIESSQFLKGSQKIGQLYSYCNHGPQINQVIQKLLCQTVQPLIRWIGSWVYYGQLEDKNEEFFIKETKLNQNMNQQNQSTFIIQLQNQKQQLQQNDWKSRFNLLEKKICPFIDLDVAQKILVAGKSVNFLKYHCNEQQILIDQNINFQQFFESNFETAIQQFLNQILQISNFVNQKLVNIIKQKFDVKKHFINLKYYLLGNQGDFTQQLVEKFNSQLSQNGNLVYKHNLLSILQTKLKLNNDISQYLDIKLLTYQQNDKGWDIFSLDYIVEQPIQTILHQNIMIHYLRISKYLIKIKRVEHSLQNIWRDLQYSRKKSYQKIPILGQFQIKLFKQNNELLHIITCLQSYLYLDVIEQHWQEFYDSIDQVQHLDELIDKHEEFIDKILQESLLNHSIYPYFQNLFSMITEFENLIFKYQNLLKSVDNVWLGQKLRMEIEGQENNLEFPIALQKYLKETIQQYLSLEQGFQSNIEILMEKMKIQPEEHFKRLRIKLDFNEFYENKKQDSIYKEFESFSDDFGLKMKNDEILGFTNFNKNENILQKFNLQQQDDMSEEEISVDEIKISDLQQLKPTTQKDASVELTFSSGSNQ